MKQNWQRRIIVVVGLAFSIFFLWLALRKFNLQSLNDTFKTIGFIPLIFCALGLVSSILLRAVRWRIIAGSPRTEQNHFSRATKLGVLANLIFPARSGELIRVITLANLSHTSLSKPMASAVIDRLVDVFVLLASATFLYFLIPINTVLEKWLIVLLVIGCGGILIVVLYARSEGIGEILISRLANRWLQRWPLQPEAFLAELRAEFRRLSKSWLSIELLLYALLILFAEYVAIATLLQAFNITAPYEAPLFLLVCLAAGSALPSAPSYVGIYQVAAVWALSYYEVSATTAVAIATILQITTLAVAIVMAGPGALAGCKRSLLQ